MFVKINHLETDLNHHMPSPWWGWGLYAVDGLCFNGVILSSSITYSIFSNPLVVAVCDPPAPLQATCAGMADFVCRGLLL